MTNFFETTEQSALENKLSEYFFKYEKLFKEGGKIAKIIECKKMIEEIQIEISKRDVEIQNVSLTEEFWANSFM